MRPINFAGYRVTRNILDGLYYAEVPADETTARTLKHKTVNGLKVLIEGNPLPVPQLDPWELPRARRA